jgi:hypothetical protein
VKENGGLNMSLPWDFGRKYQEKKGDIVKAIANYKSPDVKFSNGMLSFTTKIVDKLFSEVIDGIVKHISSLLELPKLKEVKYIFCVGGFCESELLHKAISAKIDKRADVLVPEEASLAVVKGAVEFGHGPDVISSRIAAKTYGVKTWTEFIPFLHKREKAIKLEGKVYSTDMFKVYVKKGDEVPLGYSYKSEYSPIRDEQDAAKISLYSVDRHEVMYITDDGVEHHGDIEVDWPGSGKNRQLEITMVFGGTEIEVSAVTHPGGKKQQTTINFYTE